MIPFPPWDCVVIVMKEGFGRDGQSGSSALGCGHIVELWVIEIIPRLIFSMACGQVADR